MKESEDIEIEEWKNYLAYLNYVESNGKYEIIGLGYGLRRSELVALKWDSIDFENKTITIQRKTVYSKKNGKRELVFKDSTKTKAGYRTLPLIPVAENLLKMQKLMIESDKKFMEVHTIVIMMVSFLYGMMVE